MSLSWPTTTPSKPAPAPVPVTFPAPAPAPATVPVVNVPPSERGGSNIASISGPSTIGGFELNSNPFGWGPIRQMYPGTDNFNDVFIPAPLIPYQSTQSKLGQETYNKTGFAFIGGKYYTVGLPTSTAQEAKLGDATVLSSGVVGTTPVDPLAIAVKNFGFIPPAWGRVFGVNGRRGLSGLYGFNARPPGGRNNTVANPFQALGRNLQAVAGRFTVNTQKKAKKPSKPRFVLAKAA